jgi:hypothetical protein
MAATAKRRAQATLRPITSLKSAAVLTVCLLAGLLSAVSAQATRPRLSWTLPATVNASSPTSFSWTAVNLSAGSQLAVQRQEGTTRAWRTVVRLTGTSGSASLPGLPMGTYRLRLTVLNSRHIALGQVQRGLKVFGQVPLSSLFPQNNKGVYTTPTGTFAYLYNFPRGATPAITDARNNCRSIHLEFVPGVNYVYPEDLTESGSLTVVQETQDPVSVTRPYNTLGTLDVTLIPGQSWSINLSPNGKNELGYYFNGSASCYSAAPAEPPL